MAVQRPALGQRAQEPPKAPGAVQLSVTARPPSRVTSPGPHGFWERANDKAGKGWNQGFLK